MPENLLAGRYRLETRLGRGGMGTVWRARDEFLGRAVAVKEIRLPAGTSPREHAELCDRTVREARAAAALAHPSIITVHDVLTEDGRPWIVMDLVHGQSLEDVRTSRGPLPPRQVAEIGLQLLDALSLAHRHGILHRDVKPHNVLLSSDSRAVLTDFGIATSADEQPLTTPEGLVGSPGFMAPERLAEADGIGPASDLWSLGATLYAAVEGEPPFARGDSLAVLGAVLTQPPAPPRHAGPLGPVLLAVLAKDPAARPGPAELRQAFQAVAAGAPVPLRPPPARSDPALAPTVRLAPAAPTAAWGPPPLPPATARTRGRGPLIAAAALVALAVPGTAGAGYLFLTRDTPAPPAAGPAASASPVAGSGTSASPAGTAGPATRPGASGSSVGRPGAGPPDACSLLTPDQAEELTGSGTGRASGAGGCSWQGLDLTVRFFPDRRGKPGAAQAKEAFALFRRQAAGEAGVSSDPAAVSRTSRPATVSGLGDEAFSQEQTTEGIFSAVHGRVVVRSGAVVLELDARSVDGSESSSKLRALAVAAGRDAVTNLTPTS